MKKSIEILISEAESKLSGYAGLLNYRYLNLCVKAEPMALLSIVVRDRHGEEKNLDDLAGIMLADKYTFEVVPHDFDLIPDICKGVQETHPEFKQEVITPSDENRFYRNGDDVDQSEKHILLRMPEVDKNRYDVITGGVKTLYGECRQELEKLKASYTEKLTERVATLSEDEAKEAKEALQQVFDNYTNLCTEYRDNKLKEVDEAFQQWQLGRGVSAQSAADESYDYDVTKGIKMF